MAEASRTDGDRTRGYELLREVALTGVAVIVPAVISVYVLVVLFGVINRLLGPIAAILPGADGLVKQLLAAGALVGLVLVVGFVAHFRTGKRAIDYFDAAMGRVPGVGTVYRSFRRMSDIMLEGDANHFREVKLVAFPDEDTYALGFETARTPATIADPAGHEEMITLFVPLAPNPVMGGFVVHVPADRVHDLDMSVEDGIRATVTSGVALGGGDLEGSFGGAVWQLPDFEDVRTLDVEDLRELDVDEIEERLLDGRDANTGERAGDEP